MWNTFPTYVYPYMNYVYSMPMHLNQPLQPVQHHNVDNVQRESPAENKAALLHKKIILTIEDLQQLDYKPDKKGWTET